MSDDTFLPAAEGMPESYDAAQVQAAVRQVVEPIQGEVSSQAEQLRKLQIPTLPIIGPPRYNNVKRLAMKAQRSEVLDGLSDTRAANVEVVDGLGLQGGMQRFRMEPVFSLIPWFMANTNQYNLTVFEDTWPPSQYSSALLANSYYWLTGGRIITGIPHDLGRIPEFFYGSMSSGPDGPTGQKVTFYSNSVAEGVPDSPTEFQCGIDFIPIFGIDAEDIQLQMEMLFKFDNSAGSVLSRFDLSDNVGGNPNATLWDNPAISYRLLNQMVTTEERFSGILVLTCWGVPTFHMNVMSVGISGGYYPWLMQRTVGELADTATKILLPLGGMIYPQISKFAYFHQGAMGGEVWTSLNDAIDEGLEYRLEEGTVDFIIG